MLYGGGRGVEDLLYNKKNLIHIYFKSRPNAGCNDALYTVKSVVNHCSKNGCTVTVSALDISKAFDRISHNALFSKLMLRKFPR